MYDAEFSLNFYQQTNYYTMMQNCCEYILEDTELQVMHAIFCITCACKYVCISTVNVFAFKRI